MRVASQERQTVRPFVESERGRTHMPTSASGLQNNRVLLGWILGRSTTA